MYTTVNQFIAERKNTTGTRVNENILDGVDGDATAQPIDTDVQPEAQEEEGSEELTFDAFKDAYMAKYNEYTAELEEGQEAEPVLSDAQLQMIFDVMNSLEGSVDTDAQPGDDMSAQPDADDMDATALEEGLGSFFKGGTKEELAEKKNAFDARVKEIESKFAGKTLLFKEHGDNKTVPYSADVANKVAAKNNYLGTLSTFTQGDKVIVMYKEGAKGLNKLAAGTKAGTVGA